MNETKEIMINKDKTMYPEPSTSIKVTSFHPIEICRYGNMAIIVFVSLYFFIIPMCIITYYLIDPHLNGDGIPKIAFWSHRSLSPKYEKWARTRVAQKQAEQLSLEDIAGTEWPLFVTCPIFLYQS